MNYRNHGDEYGRRGVPGSGRSRRYGRRGVPGTGRRGRYSGEDDSEEMMNEMYGAHREYRRGKEEYRRGNYGAKDDTMESLECMMESVVDFIEALKKNADSQEEVELIQKYTEEISEM